MSVEHAKRSWVNRCAPLLLGFLIAAGACARRAQETRGSVSSSGAGGNGLAGSVAVAVGPHLAAANREQRFPPEEPLRRLPMSGPGSYSEEARPPLSVPLGATGAGLMSALQGDEVYALVDDDGDHEVDRVHVVARGLDRLGWGTHRAGASSDAELTRLLGIDGLELWRDRAAKRVVVVTDKLPARQHHGWRYVRFGAGGWLYIPVRVTYQA